MPKCLRCGAGSEWIQGRVPKESAVDSLTAEQKLEEKAAINTNVRLFDLVRFMRGELHDAGLITNSEYFWLVSNSDITESGKGGSPSPRRLEDYDELAAKLEQANAKIKNFEQLREGDFKLVRDFAEGVGIKIMASNKLPGRQWEQFAQGIYDMQAKLEQAENENNFNRHRLSLVEAELEQANANKERLDWLDTCDSVSWVPMGKGEPIRISTPGIFPIPTDIRKCIDAAKLTEGKG